MPEIDRRGWKISQWCGSVQVQDCLDAVLSSIPVTVSSFQFENLGRFSRFWATPGPWTTVVSGLLLAYAKSNFWTHGNFCNERSSAYYSVSAYTVSDIQRIALDLLWRGIHESLPNTIMKALGIVLFHVYENKLFCYELLTVQPHSCHLGKLLWHTDISKGLAQYLTDLTSAQ